MTKHLIYKYRVNGTGATFYELMVKDLEGLKDYTNAAKGAKTMKTAIKKINADYEDKYAYCYRNYATMTDLGAIKKSLLTPEIEKLSMTKYTKEELMQRITEISPEIAKMCEGRL